MRVSEDTLFLAMTRPAMVMGLPLEAAMLVMGIGAATMILLGNPIYAGLITGICYLVVKTLVRFDVNMFRLLFLWCATTLKCPNRKFWGGSSYSPTRTIGTKRTGFGRV